jgi:hypothetical protein
VTVAGVVVPVSRAVRTTVVSATTGLGMTVSVFRTTAPLTGIDRLVARGHDVGAGAPVIVNVVGKPE